jgi:ATP-dependent helicase HrpB
VSLEKFPVEEKRTEIQDALKVRGICVVKAPPGSGKSTIVPQICLEIAPAQGRVYVLQPRRIAARQLAVFVSELCESPLGNKVGYKVRFEDCTSKSTRIIFETYGIFVRQLLSGNMPGPNDTLILDEFHERTLEMDLVIAWFRFLQKVQSPHTPRCIIMSATIQKESTFFLEDNVPTIEAHGRMFPVEIHYQPPVAQERLDSQVLRALVTISQKCNTGSVLVFASGNAEIKQIVDGLTPWCQSHGRSVYGLHGAMSLWEQSQVITSAASGKTIIVSTNVAETSLTIPGVTAVIDSGYAMKAAYDPQRERNTLYRAGITQSSAEQRAGRAGRIAPGICVRLWPRHDDSRSLTPLEPEIRRLELSTIVLSALGILDVYDVSPNSPYFLPWLSEPEEDRFAVALSMLQSVGACTATGFTGLPLHLSDKGREYLTYGIHPMSASILSESALVPGCLVSIAMLALWENAGRSITGEIYGLGCELAQGKKNGVFTREVHEAFKHLCNCGASGNCKQQNLIATSNDDDSVKRAIAAIWMRVMRSRIGILDTAGSRYVLVDGSSAFIHDTQKHSDLPEAILLLTSAENDNGKTGRKHVVHLYVSIKKEWIPQVLSDTVESHRFPLWDEKKKRIFMRTEGRIGTLVLDRHDEPVSPPDRDAAAEVLMQNIGDIKTTADDAVISFLTRMDCVANAFPELGFKPLSDEDWQLIACEFCEGSSSISELEERTLLPVVLRYVGHEHVRTIDQLAPEYIALPSGKRGRITYPASSPPELSARIGELVGVTKPFSVCKGRVPGIYNILAPNYRTVQKTADIEGFWKNAYPAIKQEFKRRYPRHIWP